MLRKILGFDWDQANREKCGKHGVALAEIEGLFVGPVMVLPDETHSERERRYRAVGRTEEGRYVFVVFTIRRRHIRPISARFMHRKEIDHYEKENPNV